MNKLKEDIKGEENKEEKKDDYQHTAYLKNISQNLLDLIDNAPHDDF